MCNVCIADQALAVTTCGKTTCVAFQEGYRVTWSDGPKRVVLRLHRKTRAKGSKTMDFKEPATVFVRAQGKGSECKPAEYQIRREFERWPKTWTKTNDLAGPMGSYGFDVKWKYVPKPVQEYVLGQRDKLPTEKELAMYYAERASKRRVIKTKKKSSRSK